MRWHYELDFRDINKFIEINLAILIPPNDPRSLICALMIIVVLFRKKTFPKILAFCMYCPHQVCCQILIYNNFVNQGYTAFVFLYIDK